MLAVMDISSYYMGVTCFSCSSHDIEVDYKAGDVICGQCGVVQTSRLIDQGNEVRSYEDDDGRTTSRTSGLSDSLGSSTVVFVAGPEKDRLILERARKAAANRKETAVLANLITLNEFCAKMNLSPGIKSQASEIFQKVLMENIVRSTSKDCIAAACIYLACRMEGYPRLLDEVSEACHVDMALMSKHQSAIARKLSLSLRRITPSDLVNRMARKLHWIHDHVELAYEVVSNCVRFELFESSQPQAVVAAVLTWLRVLLSLRSQEDAKGQSEPLYHEEIRSIAQTCFVSPDVVNSMYKTMMPSIPILLPDKLSIKPEMLRACPASLDKLPNRSKGDSPTENSVKKENLPQVYRTPKGLKKRPSSSDPSITELSPTKKGRPL